MKFLFFCLLFFRCQPFLFSEWNHCLGAWCARWIVWNYSILIIFHFFSFSAFDRCLFIVRLSSSSSSSFCACFHSIFAGQMYQLCLATSIVCLFSALENVSGNFSWLQNSVVVVAGFFTSSAASQMKCAQSGRWHRCKCISFLCNSYVSIAKHDAYRRHQQQPWIALHSWTLCMCVCVCLRFFSLFCCFSFTKRARQRAQHAFFLRYFVGIAVCVHALICFTYLQLHSISPSR